MMICRSSLTLLLALLLTGLFGVRTYSQELFYLKNSLDSQADAAGGSARQLLNELLAQPKEVRNAVLEVSQHPDLLVRLKYLDGSSPDAQAKLLAEYPKEAADAARVLVANGPLFKKVADQVVAAGLLGQMYAKERDVVRQMADQIGQKRAEQSAASAGAWDERLAKDAAAAAQLRQSLDSHPGSGGSILLRPAGAPEASNLPTGEQAAYILANADQFPELAAQIVDQWERERNPDDFRAAVDYWYAQNRAILPLDMIREPAELAKLLKEHAVFERDYAQAAMAAGPIKPDRLTYLETNSQKYPMLTEARQEKTFAEARARPSKVFGGPYTGSTKGGSSSSKSSSGGDSSMRSSRSNSIRAASNRSSNRGNNRNNRNSNNGFGGNSGGFGGNSGGFGGNSGGFGGNSGGSGNSGGFGNSGSSGFGGSNSSFGSGSRSGSSSFGSSGSRFGSSQNSSSNNNR